MAKKYNEKEVVDWTTNNFLEYLSAKHEETYGVEYVPPGRSWNLERGLIGGLIGTKGKNAKPRKYSPELVKRFIDECFRTHKLNGYSGVSFTWFWKWKTEIWQRVLIDSLSEESNEKAIKSSDKFDEVSDWL
jgi:hypothetical protein